MEKGFSVGLSFVRQELRKRNEKKMKKRRRKIKREKERMIMGKMKMMIKFVSCMAHELVNSDVVYDKLEKKRRKFSKSFNSHLLQ